MLKEEITRIKNLMSLNEEGGAMDDIAKFIVKQLKNGFAAGGLVDDYVKVFSKNSDEIASLTTFFRKLKDGNYKPTDDELRLIIRNLNDGSIDFAKLGKEAYQNGTLANKQAIDNTLIKSAQNIKTKEEYDELLELFKRWESTGYNKFPDGKVPEELKPFFTSYSKEVKDDFLQNIYKYNRPFWVKNLDSGKIENAILDWINSGSNVRTSIIGILKGLIQSQETIEAKMLDDLIRLQLDFIAKKGNINAEPYAKRIFQNAIGASKTNKSNLESFLKKQINDSGIPYEIKDLINKTEIFEYFAELTKKENLPPGILDSFKRFFSLFEPRRWLGEYGEKLKSTGPQEQFARALNTIITTSPYSHKEYLARVVQKGLWPTVASKLVGTMVLSLGIIPALYGAANLIKGGFYEFFNTFGLQSMYNPDYGPEGEMHRRLHEYFFDAFWPVAEQRLIGLDIPITFVDDLYRLDKYTPPTRDDSQVMKAAEYAKSILEGQTIEENWSDNVVFVDLNNAVKTEIKRLYPDLNENKITKMNLSPADLRVYYTDRDGKTYPMELKNGRIYVVNSQQNLEIEINNI
jgi:hypothetical protein